MKAFDLILCLAVVYLYYKTRKPGTLSDVLGQPMPKIPMQSVPVSIEP